MRDAMRIGDGVVYLELQVKGIDGLAEAPSAAYRIESQSTGRARNTSPRQAIRARWFNVDVPRLAGRLVPLPSARRRGCEKCGAAPGNRFDHDVRESEGVTASCW